jgi:hypothetical protein
MGLILSPKKRCVEVLNMSTSKYNFLLKRSLCLRSIGWIQPNVSAALHNRGEIWTQLCTEERLGEETQGE